MAHVPEFHEDKAFLHRRITESQEERPKQGQSHGLGASRYVVPWLNVEPLYWPIRRAIYVLSLLDRCCFGGFGVEFTSGVVSESLDG